MTCTKKCKKQSIVALCLLFSFQMSWLTRFNSGGNNRFDRFVAHAMSIQGRRESHMTTKTKIPSHSTRARFLSSSAAAFVTASAGVIGFVGANSPEECWAAAAAPSSNENFKDNPRYIDTEMQMKYGESPGMPNCSFEINYY